MEKLILVDGNSLMYRAFYGQGDPTKIKPNSKGVYTNAINAFARMINILKKNNQYDYLLVAFDKGKHTFRHDIMPDYKAGRAHMADEMRMQIPYIKDFLKRANIAQFEIDDYEADDICGTFNSLALKNGLCVDVYSSDKDLLQLIGENTNVYMTIKGMSEVEKYDINHFKEVYEIEPSQFIDLKALMGDKSDNISGVPGIGPKKGIKLLKEYGTVEEILDNIEQIKGADKEKFIANADLLKTCKTMVTILRDAPLGLDLDYAIKKDADNEALKELYEELELNGLLKELKENSDVLVSDTTNNVPYTFVSNEEELEHVIDVPSSLHVETLDQNYHKDSILSLAISNNHGVFVLDTKLLESNPLKEFLENKNIEKYVFDFKKTYTLLKKKNINLKGVTFDLLLATYVINPTNASHEFKTVVQSYEYYDVSFDSEIYGKGAKLKVPANDILFSHTANKVFAISKVKDLVIRKLVENDSFILFSEIELLLARVLADMEICGVTIDKEEMAKQKVDLEERINFIEEEIYRLTGYTFNVSSPKQLAEVLFEKLEIPYPKKTKKSYSTSAEILQSIIDKHPAIEYILSYRQLTKLYQTYIVGLNDQIFSDSKVHTIYEQALTETGRLSSIEPNLQNIPTKTLDGKNIRKIFVPNDKDNLFLSCDYSQVELRVLASLANVSKLIEAFNNDEDIHKSTASLIFNKDINSVTDLERRQAKAVNFGIIYGQSAYGLAQETGMSNKEASNFIEEYYKHYPEIKDYMNKTISDCETNLYVKTILNRRRYIPDINSKNFMLREFAKRTAMNAPIQGSAADIIKIAMINIDKEIKEKKLKSKMILQIHDELIFEVYPDESNIILELVERNMTEAYKLKVKLVISKDFGKTLYEV